MVHLDLPVGEFVFLSEVGSFLHHRRVVIAVQSLLVFPFVDQKEGFRIICRIEIVIADATYGSPEIINSYQGYQFTCKAWLDACAQHPRMRVSMDGRGRAKDNIWIERFWKTIKYEYIYILSEENGAALFSGIKRFIDNYNYHRRHQGIDRQVPSKLYIRPAA